MIPFRGIAIVRLEEFPYRALQILRYQEQMDAYLRSRCCAYHTVLL